MTARQTLPIPRLSLLLTHAGMLAEQVLRAFWPFFSILMAILAVLMQYLPQVTTKLVDFTIYGDLFEAVTGIKMTAGEFLEAGDRIHVLERYMNTREGISRKDDTLPARFLKEELTPQSLLEAENQGNA